MFAHCGAPGDEGQGRALNVRFGGPTLKPCCRAKRKNLRLPIGVGSVSVTKFPTASLTVHCTPLRCSGQLPVTLLGQAEVTVEFVPLCLGMDYA